MPRPPKATPSRSTPRPSTRSQQQSPPRAKPSVILTLKNPRTASNRGETSDNDNESVSSSSKSSEIILRGAVANDRAPDGPSINRAPWRHPDELNYFRPSDWSEDRIISQLRSIVFTVPPPVLGKQSFIEITLYDGGNFDKPKRVKVPRGYRVPLMFVAKFQWASLRLVLTSGQREKEWSDYKFDILHLSRLCERFFLEAQKACQHGVIEIPPIKSKAADIQADPETMTRRWRCPTFDRALARYNKNWLISREEFLRDFYIEFEDEEYAKDVLKIDWSRWALKGHKGFKLTPDELKIGIDGRMLTRGLKKDSDGKWIWVDDYVIKQEEVAAAVLPAAFPPPVVEKHHTSENDGRSTPHPHLMSSQNGRLSPLPNDMSPEPIVAPVEPTTPQAAPSVKEIAPSGGSDEQISSEKSEQEIADESHEPQIIQLNSTEKSHSPLTNLSSSATPGIPVPLPSSDIIEPPPVNDVEIVKEAIAPISSTPPLPETTIEVTATVQPSPQPNPPLGPLAHSKPPTPQLPFLLPLTIPTVPDLRQSPQSPQRSTPTTASVSEVTQPPRSPSPPPEPRSKSVDLVVETSPLTPLHPETSFSDQGQDFALRTLTEGSKADTETLGTDSRFSPPTSIDSTPAPSPTIPPICLTESTDTIPSTGLETPTKGPGTDTAVIPTSLPEKKVFVDPACLFHSFVPQAKSPTTNGVSPETTYEHPRSTSPWQNDIDVRQRSSASIRHQTPVFLSPLLPPATRSRSASPDEIPGLGALSSRRTYSLPPQFVTPMLTARTVTHDSSWHIPELGEETKGDFLDDSAQLQYPSYSPEVSEKPEDEIVEPAVEVELDGSARNDGDAAVREITPPAEENFQSNKALLSNQATPTVTPIHSISQSQGRTFSHVQGSDYDDDSDMDFGTPVTSPVIIVPGPNAGSIDMLPPPASPCPVPPAKCKPTNPSSTSPQARQKTPHRPLPRDITTTPRASTQSPVSPSPYGASTSTPRPISPYRTEAVQPASDSDVVMKILESVARDHAEKAAKEERVLPLNGFLPAPVSIESTELQTNQTAVEKPLAPVHPRPPSIPAIPLVPQETFSQPLPPSANFISSSPSPFPSTHSMASTTTRPFSALNNQNFRETTANGSHAGNSVPSISRSIAVPFQEVDMANTPQLPRTEKAGDVPVSPLENIQTDDGVSRPATQPTSSVCATTSNAEVSSHPLDLDESSQVVQSPPQTIEYSSVARKRHRDEDGDEEIDEVTTFKSLKTGESLSVREGGLVVRKVVSMVRDTLTGLNDLLEIAAERELIPSEKAGAVGKGKARAAETLSRDESPISAPSLSSPIVRSPFFTHSLVESSEVARLNEELLRMKAEMAQLKEQKTRETPAEGIFMGTMRTELEILREQLRVLKAEKGSEMGTSEVQAMRNEILSLKTEMRSLLSPSNRSSGGPTTPSTPNLSFRFNNHATSHTIHPLAHLLAVESDTVPSTPTTASTVEVGQNEGDLARLSQKSRVQFDDESRSDRTRAVSRTPAVFDDLPIPVKSKRKSRMFFSRS